jgi:hypothetical protein
MKVIALGVLLVGVWGALPEPTRAQQVSPTPLELLMENRQALLLTEAQLTRLETIRASLTQRNEPLVARIVELRAQWQREQRAARAEGRQQGRRALRQAPPLLGGQVQPTPRMEDIRTSAQAVLEQIQENNRAAMQEVQQVLTRPQRARLRELLQARRPLPGRGAAGAGAAGGLPGRAGLGG